MCGAVRSGWGIPGNGMTHILIVNGCFEIGNLGDRIYTFFVGQYGNVYYSPKESPILFHVTGDSFMPEPLPGRALIEPDVLNRIEAFERPYRSFFRTSNRIT